MKIFIANWKLHPLKFKDASALCAKISGIKTKNKVVLCPPLPYLPLLKTKFELGAQNISAEKEGAFTGEVSAAMLKQFKVKYAIIGHSERRELGETDFEINKKIAQALENKIVPVLCVGFGIQKDEAEEEVLGHLKRQLQEDLQGIDPKKVLVAYEPVWAIGTGKPATPEHAERVAMFIRIQFKVSKILYGGSSNAENFREFLERQIDGLLVGGASLDPKQFGEMIQSK